MQAGDLRDRVTIQQATTTADGQGGTSVTWATLVTVWGSVVPTRASEGLAVGMVSTALYNVVIRYRADITAQMRLLWTPYRASSAKTLEIHGVQPLDGGRAFLRMDCGEAS